MPLLFDKNGQLYNAEFAAPISDEEVEDNLREAEDLVSDTKEILAAARKQREGGSSEDKGEDKAEPTAPAVPQAPEVPATPAPAAPAAPVAPETPAVPTVSPETPPAPSIPISDNQVTVL